MHARGPGHAILRLGAEYHRTWNATGPAGRAFLVGGLIYLIRVLAFSAAFPLYANEKGYSPGEIGLFLAASQFSLFLLGVPVTFLGGRGHARRVLTVMPGIGALGIAIILLAPQGSAMLVALAALLAGAGGASFWVLGDPLLAQTTPAGERAHVYALKFFVLTLAVSLGGGLGGWIPGLLEGAANLSELSALSATLAVFGLLDLVQIGLFARIPPYEAPRPDSRSTAAPTRSGNRRAWLPWAVLIAFAIPEIGMSLGHNSVRPFMSLFFTQEHGFSTSSTGTALAVLGMLSGIGALAAPRFAARFGNIPAIAILRVGGALTILLWFTGIGLPPILALMVVYYVAMDGTEAIFIAESMNRLPVSRRTWFSGIYAMAWSISASCASLLSGEIQERNDGRFGAAFALGVVGYLFSVAWLLFVLPRLPVIRDPGSDSPASSRTDASDRSASAPR